MSNIRLMDIRGLIDWWWLWRKKKDLPLMFRLPNWQERLDPRNGLLAAVDQSGHFLKLAKASLTSVKANVIKFASFSSQTRYNARRLESNVIMIIRNLFLRKMPFCLVIFHATHKGSSLDALTMNGIQVPVPRLDPCWGWVWLSGGETGDCADCVQSHVPKGYLCYDLMAGRNLGLQ